MPSRAKQFAPAWVKDSRRRPRSSSRGYDYAWQKFRAWFLRQSENGKCEGCGKVAANPLKELEVHHVIPIARRPDLRLDPENCKPLCPPCHAAEENRRRGVGGGEISTEDSL